MEPRLRRPWGRLIAEKSRLLEKLGTHPEALRLRRPGAEQWSMIEVVEHLILVEDGITAALAKEPSPDRARVVVPGRWFRYPALRLALKTGVRIKVPVPAILPTRSVPWHALLSRWEYGRRHLEEWLLSIHPATISEPRFKHPLVGWLDVRQSLTFAGDHLRHHFRQVERIERTLKGEGGRVSPGC